METKKPPISKPCRWCKTERSRYACVECGATYCSREHQELDVGHTEHCKEVREAFAYLKSVIDNDQIDDVGMQNDETQEKHRNMMDVMKLVVDKLTVTDAAHLGLVERETHNLVRSSILWKRYFETTFLIPFPNIVNDPAIKQRIDQARTDSRQWFYVCVESNRLAFDGWMMFNMSESVKHRPFAIHGIPGLCLSDVKNNNIGIANALSGRVVLCFWISGTGNDRKLVCRSLDPSTLMLGNVETPEIVGTIPPGVALVETENVGSVANDHRMISRIVMKGTASNEKDLVLVDMHTSFPEVEPIVPMTETMFRVVGTDPRIVAIKPVACLRPSCCRTFCRDGSLVRVVGKMVASSSKRQEQQQQQQQRNPVDEIHVSYEVEFYTRQSFEENSKKLEKWTTKLSVVDPTNPTETAEGYEMSDVFEVREVDIPETVNGPVVVVSTRISGRPGAANVLYLVDRTGVLSSTTVMCDIEPNGINGSACRIATLGSMVFSIYHRRDNNISWKRLDFDKFPKWPATKKNAPGYKATLMCFSTASRVDEFPTVVHKTVFGPSRHTENIIPISGDTITVSVDLDATITRKFKKGFVTEKAPFKYTSVDLIPSDCFTSGPIESYDIFTDYVNTKRNSFNSSRAIYITTPSEMVGAFSRIAIVSQDIHGFLVVSGIGRTKYPQYVLPIV